jgi:hypothetical protein
VNQKITNFTFSFKGKIVLFSDEFLKTIHVRAIKESVMQSMPEAGAGGNDHGSEESARMGKSVEHSLPYLPKFRESSLWLRMTAPFVFCNLKVSFLLIT